MGNFQHRKKSRDEGPEEEGFLYRALAAAIAIPLFEVSLFIGICAARISGRSAYFFFSIPAWLHIVYCSVAVAVGLIFGFRDLTWLLGHLFMTHFENDQDERITIALGLRFSDSGHWVTGFRNEERQNGPPKAVARFRAIPIIPKKRFLQR